MNRFKAFGRKVSRNNTRTVWVLKCDIRKFFASIDHKILKNILQQHLSDTDSRWLLRQVVNSFHTDQKKGVGLPLGNLTSQLLVNIYMNEFDQFMKRKMKVRYYVRYADDFLILHGNKLYLENLIPKISEFLEKQLSLSLNPNKLFIKTLASGVDFLGWIHFPNYRVLRTATKRRMLRKIKQNNNNHATIISYIGLLKHGNTHKLLERIQKKSYK